MPKRNDKLKTVWVLGAGFSRPLGGPLLTHLLSDTMAQDVAIRFPETAEGSDVAQDVRILYRAGLVGSSGINSRPSHNLWQDPEEFLEYLDTAAEDDKGPLASRLGKVLSGVTPIGITPRRAPKSLSELLGTAKRMVAAECSAFLIGANTKGERWDPYHGWSRQLTYQDTIITFNYDRVLDNLDSKQASGGPPGTDWGIHRDANICRILRLHGSVDWYRQEVQGQLRFETRQHVAITAGDFQIAIATPGPSKRAAAVMYEELWTLAKEALREADVIVFVGYRFPPSDAEARGALLGAIRDNRAASKHLRVNIVLGPERNPDVIRLEQMLRAVCRGKARVEVPRAEAPGLQWAPHMIGSFDIATHAMWAQDFFSVCSRELLEEENRIQGGG